jgi:TatD DNase family protein
MRLIDCHCHLDDRKYDADREEIIARNRGRVEAIITSGVSLASNSATLALAKKHPAFVFASLGLSPAFVGEMTDADVDAVIEQVRANARRIVAV